MCVWRWMVTTDGAQLRAFAPMNKQQQHGDRSCLCKRYEKKDWLE